MVDGCLAWQRDGLGEPEQVKAATEGYRSESDTFAQWWEERGQVERSTYCRANVAYQSYKAWCEAANERSISQRRFGERVAEMGIDKRRSNGWIYDGIKLV